MEDLQAAYFPFAVMAAVPLHGVFAKIECQMIILLIIVGSLLVFQHTAARRRLGGASWLKRFFKRKN